MMEWQSAASLAALHRRAHLLQQVRSFFYERDVLEVETPLLSRAGVTDPSIEPFVVSSGRALSEPRYLQTSPEYAMKRLVAQFAVPMFQICKAFRDDEVGRRHNPEFTLLEWYRPGFDHHALMDEVIDLIHSILGELPVVRISYQGLFEKHLSVNPHLATIDELRELAINRLQGVDQLHGDSDFWLNLLLTHLIEPKLQGLHVVYDYPASQAALARTARVNGVTVAQRFEVYCNSVELANGYFELSDANEQRERFERDNGLRQQRGQSALPIDEALLAALAHGLPSCSGVALGIERLLLAAEPESQQSIGRVMAFDWKDA